MYQGNMEEFIDNINKVLISKNIGITLRFINYPEKGMGLAVNERGCLIQWISDDESFEDQVYEYLKEQPEIDRYVSE